MSRKINKNRTIHSAPKISKMLIKLERMINNWEEAKNTDTYIFLSHPKRAIWANMIIGVSRGVGFVIGVSIISVVLLTILGSLLSHFVTIPIIGEFIALIVESVQEYLGNR